MSVSCKTGVSEFPRGKGLESSLAFPAIPVPDEVAENFIPKETERVRLEVRSEVLYLEEAHAAGVVM